MNAESATKLAYKGKKLSEMEIARPLGVNSYPTIIFLDPQGEQIDRLSGYVDAEHFLPIIKFIGSDAYKTMSWEKYQSENDPALKQAN